MNFNRIQKYRQEKLASETVRPKGGLLVRNRDNLPIESKNTYEINTSNKQIQQKLTIEVNEPDQSFLHSRQITLRDYMYITSKSARKHNSNKKQNSTSQSQKTIASNVTLSAHRHKSTFRKQKYETSNKQIFQLVKTDINKDFNRIFDSMKEIKGKLEEVFQNEKITRQTMIDLYNIKNMLREGIIKQLESIDEMVNTTKNGDRIPLVQETKIDQKKADEKIRDPNSISKSIYLRQSQGSVSAKNLSRSFKK